MYHYLLLLAILTPIAGGVAVLRTKSKQSGNVLYLEILALCFLFNVAAALLGSGLAAQANTGILVFRFGGDRMGQFFAILDSLIFLMSGIFSIDYNAHDANSGRYNGFYLLTLGSVMGLCYAQNLLTFYCFYECMTLMSMPLVFHNGDDEARRAGFKYLGYSLFGASLVLFGFFFMGQYCDIVGFQSGGTFNEVGQAHLPMALLAAFAMLMGFGCKAGIMPLHDWLPTAHPVAPAPASAVLSATITKAGVLGIIRVIYFVVGPEVLRGTWVQKTMLLLTLITVFGGSMLAYRTKLLKRRLAWSTVSQVSYALYGLFLMQETAFCGALMQVVFHAFSKAVLFLAAGAIIHQTGKTYVYELDGVGRRMPKVYAFFALASLSLVGLPPFAGFVSKWNLATGGMAAAGTLGIAGGAVLLISALLTAGYLFPVVIHGFLYEGEGGEPCEPGWRMLVPLGILAVGLLLMGIVTGPMGWITAVLAEAF